jgi:hypothetical protein
MLARTISAAVAVALAFATTARADSPDEPKGLYPLPPPPVARVVAPSPPAPMVVGAPGPVPLPEPPGEPLAFELDARLALSINSVTVSSAGTTIPVAPGTLATVFYSSSLPVPQLAAGVRSGRFAALLGFGFSYSAPSSVTGSSPNVSQIVLAPTGTADLFRSYDGRVAVYGLFGLLLAPVVVNFTLSNGVTPATAQSELDLNVGLQIAVGARFALHRNFRIGLEAGPLVQFLRVDENNSPTTVSFYGALVGSFVYPQ